MRSPLWSVISLITANIALAAAILLAINIHWVIGLVALGLFAIVLLPLLRRRERP